MSKKRMVFPMEVQSGSVIVKIYKVENKGRDSFTVSYFALPSRKFTLDRAPGQEDSGLP